MKQLNAQIVVCGASLGGTLAAYSAAKSGFSVILTEQTDWIGGQLTSQAVPPDEHPWIEETGCTATYRQYRNKVRQKYIENPDFRLDRQADMQFCPGDSLVSWLAHPPKLALEILNEMLAPFVGKNLTLLLNTHLCDCNKVGNKIISVRCQSKDEQYQLLGEMFLDGTDTGELVCLSKTAYSVGAESFAQTGEIHAPQQADPTDMQPATYTAALENCIDGHFVIEKPQMYDYYNSLTVPYDNVKLFSMYGPDSSTGKAKQFGMFEGEIGKHGELFSLFRYRRIVCAQNFKSGVPFDVTLVNWPQNDFFFGNLFDCNDAEENNFKARQLTLSLVYWLQTEAPRADGGKGYPQFRLAKEYLGTPDGLSKSPYIRESRRIKAMFTVTENMLQKGSNCAFFDSVGVGSYPIDLHITTHNHTFLYGATEKFTIPLGAMIPVETENLIPACKNIGTTHLTNGCYRLHPVEWNVGEAAGYFACFALKNNVPLKQVRQDADLLKRFQNLLVQNGIQLYWNEELCNKVKLRKK